LVEKSEAGRIFASHFVQARRDASASTVKCTSRCRKKAHLIQAGRPGLRAAGIRFGIQLCYDAHFPELATRMALDGAEVIFMPHASRAVPRRKNATPGCGICRPGPSTTGSLSCLQSGRRQRAGLTFPGLAVAIGPDGR